MLQSTHISSYIFCLSHFVPVIYKYIHNKYEASIFASFPAHLTVAHYLPTAGQLSVGCRKKVHMKFNIKLTA